MIILPVAVLLSGAIVAHAYLKGKKRMSDALDRLTREVSETKGVAASATAALLAVPGLIRDAVAAALASGTPVDDQLNALADELDAAQAPLAAAIQQNPGPTDPGGGDTATSTVDAGAGNDTVSAGGGGDSVADAGADDTLTGGQGNDVIE